MRNKVLVFFANAPPSVREMLNRILESEDYEARWAASEREALDLARQQRPDLLLLDFNRPLRRAWDTLERLQAVNVSVPVILITEQRIEFDRAVAGRVAAFIRKPFEVSTLLRTMRELLDPLSEAAKPDVLKERAQIQTR
ncbi:MAG: response regulator [Verrucomicrobia bacterium]|nr:response regulator [Verrucomicrobiota bacterium]